MCISDTCVYMCGKIEETDRREKERAHTHDGTKVYRNPQRFRFVSRFYLCHPRILTPGKRQLLVHIASPIHSLLSRRANIATGKAVWKGRGAERWSGDTADICSSRPEIRNSRRNPFFIARSVSATVLEKPLTTTTTTRTTTTTTKRS